MTDVDRSRRWRALGLRPFAALLLGGAITLLSTFAGNRSAMATYPDIMGCETGCRVAATGWPLVFVRDYTGMSVIDTADMMEVLFAADRFDWRPFCANLLFWTMLSLFLLRRRRKSG